VVHELDHVPDGHLPNVMFMDQISRTIPEVNIIVTVSNGDSSHRGGVINFTIAPWFDVVSVYSETYYLGRTLHDVFLEYAIPNSGMAYILRLYDGLNDAECYIVEKLVKSININQMT
jgi:hypothetical protein